MSFSLCRKKVCALLGAFCIGFAFADPPSNFSGWELVFEDNFDGNELDKTKWNPTYNWGNTHNHRAYSTLPMSLLKMAN